MKRFYPLVVALLSIPVLLFAEGTRELAPNAEININGNTTTDLAALHINNPTYNSFASYTNPDPQSRLYIHVNDPENECIFFGFSFAHPNVSVPNPPQTTFEFRVKDPNGNIVYGPITVNPGGVNIQNWSEGFTGPSAIHGAGGYDAFQATSAALISQGFSGSGDYYIEFANETSSDFLIDFWDITVADCSGIVLQEKKGRVWSFNWSIFAVNDFGFPNRPFNGAFYVCAPDPDNIHASFVTKIDFNNSGFRPAAFNIAFNSTGSFNTGDVGEDRKSVMNTNATRPEYSIFLNDPIEICETAEIGEISLIGISRCSAEDYCVKIIASKAGQVDILFDFDGGDNIYTPGTADLMLVKTIAADEVGVPSCIDWDGKDGLGNPISEVAGTQIPVTIAFAQGIYHFPIYDAEFMTNGVTIEAVRPVAPTPLLYYDDSDINVSSGSGEPNMQLSGCTTPCHRWTNYTMPNTPGFGNLHTINSWWFSQLIVRQDIFVLPAYFACEVQGPSTFCEGSTAELTILPQVQPLGADAPEIVHTLWAGPGVVGPADNTTVTVGAPGTYTAFLIWASPLGDTCESMCTFEITALPSTEFSIDTLILAGDEVVINGETYTQGGTYTQLLTNSIGCDSVLTIHVQMINTVIHYDLNDCESFMHNGSHMDYSEFTPAYLQPLSCADITGTTIHRLVPPDENKHSCTPGVNGSEAMCVSSLDECDFVAGHVSAVLFELTVVPDADTAVQVTGIQFYAQAPDMYNWLSGPTGLNNYPTLYGIRVLKNGTEIFRQEDIPTTLIWNLEVFDFIGMDEFIVEEATTFTFELLPYCLIGNGSDVAAWDIDEVSIMASCVSPTELDPIVSGHIETRWIVPVANVNVWMSDDNTLPKKYHAMTNTKGDFVFEPVARFKDYNIIAEKDGDDINGVSTFDVLELQKHLLGIKPFTSAYQYIAADANKSNSVSALDIVEIRKLLLGVYDEFPRNTSWRFVNPVQQPDISLPWLVQENLVLEYITRDLSGMDFLGIKIGDLTGDAKGNPLSASVENRNIIQMRLAMADFEVHPGDEVLVNVSTEDDFDLSGLQLALDANGLEIIGIESGVLDVNPESFHIHNGNLRLSWISVMPVNLKADDVLFSIHIRSSRSGNIQDMISLAENKLAPEAYVNDPLDKADVQLQYVKEDLSRIAAPEMFIAPNPVKGNAVIHLNMSYSQQVIFIFYDFAGRELGSIQTEVVKGKNVVPFSVEDFNMSQGIYLCQLQSPGGTASTKFVVVR